MSRYTYGFPHILNFFCSVFRCYSSTTALRLRQCISHCLRTERTDIVALISKNSPRHCLDFSQHVCQLTSPIKVFLPSLSLSPFGMWAKPPFHCCPVPSGHSALFYPLPLSLHLLCLSLWLLTGSQGSSSPSSPGLSFSATQSFISGTIHWPLGRKQSGLRFWLSEGRPGQSRSGSRQTRTQLCTFHSYFHLHTILTSTQTVPCFARDMPLEGSHCQ